MEPSGDAYPGAWRPLTPRGIAVFARATFSRLFLIFLLMALVASGTVVWLLSVAWFPVVSAAIEHLPLQGEIRNGQLNWSEKSPQLLGENRFLAVAVDLDHSAESRSPAHVQVEFGQTDLRFYSLFGAYSLPYPREYLVAFNYDELKPRWGAWAPMLLAMAALASCAWFFLSWLALASVYCLPAWLLGLYGNRELSILGAWRLAGASLMPGALLMSAALALYGFGQLDLVRLLGAFALHFLVGWVYLVLGVSAAPKVPTDPSMKSNPFSNSNPQAPADPPSAPANPFRSPGD